MTYFSPQKSQALDLTAHRRVIRRIPVPDSPRVHYQMYRILLITGFRTDLHQALRDGLTALGLLGWERKDGTLQAKGGLFPWHDESLKELFEQVSEAGVDQVQELFGTMCS